jgi:hypothetical protein
MGKGAGSCSGRPGLTFAGGAAVAEAPSTATASLAETLEVWCYQPDTEQWDWWQVSLDEVHEQFPDADPQMLETFLDLQVQQGYLSKSETLAYSLQGVERTVTYARNDAGVARSAALLWEAMTPLEQGIAYELQTGSSLSVKTLANNHGCTTVEAREACQKLVQQRVIIRNNMSKTAPRYGRSWRTEIVVTAGMQPVATPTMASAPPISITPAHPSPIANALAQTILQETDLVYNSGVYEHQLEDWGCTAEELDTALASLVAAGDIEYTHSVSHNQEDGVYEDDEDDRSYMLTPAARVRLVKEKIDAYPYVVQDVLQYYREASRSIIQHGEIRADMGIPAKELTAALSQLVNDRVLMTDTTRHGYGKTAYTRSGWRLTSRGRVFMQGIEAS